MRVKGTSGNDTLVIPHGIRHTAFGRGGDDTFVFSDGNGSAKIMDYSNDSIDLSQLNVSGVDIETNGRMTELTVYTDEGSLEIRILGVGFDSGDLIFAA